MPCCKQHGSPLAVLFFSVRHSKVFKMSRRGVQVKGRGPSLRATPVFVVGVAVLVIILCVYLELMLTFPW